METTQVFLLTEDWIKKMCYIQIIAYHSTLEKEILPFATIWIELEVIMLDEKSQRKPNTI